MKKPFSENIIFVDTEFSSLDPYSCEILSIGIVKDNGDELYLELEHFGEVSDWTKENVFPSLNGKKIERGEAMKKIDEFIGRKRPRMVSYVDNFDIACLCKLFGTENYNKIFYWVTVDFASVLFGFGINPESLADRSDKNEFFRKMNVDLSKYRPHHALDDAKLLREVYLKFFETNKSD